MPADRLAHPLHHIPQDRARRGEVEADVSCADLPARQTIGERDPGLRPEERAERFLDRQLAAVQPGKECRLG